ncbi:uncharacterized protein A4U43_C06F16560 [Asparagus officinalis]|uniref:Uncharacterized protein n=1 Tax=Asparagus officinalis TaxID=4686 RepID=A0A5P1ENC2_ASPOF|nr:uncharacterized protein A4U43_C06F16560 [Asparagus officinalis]
MDKAEEDALFFQQYRASENSGEFERRVWPYVKQVFLYEDHVRQEAARKSVPVDEVEEKALVSSLASHAISSTPLSLICRYNKCDQADEASDIPTKFLSYTVCERQTLLQMHYLNWDMFFLKSICSL